MITRLRFIATGLCTVLCGLAIAFADEAEDTKADRQMRLDFLKARAAEFDLFQDADRNKPLARTGEPLLRYSNPSRGVGLSDGGTWLWLEGERPVAVAAWSIRGMGSVYREFTSFSAEPLTCVFNERVVWSPQTGGLLDQPLPGTPAPQATAAARLTQMRALARRFSAVFYKGDEPTEMRLLPQPIHRYKDEKLGLLDGGLFTFAEATDPEALLLLEARSGKKEGEAAWRFSLARMSSLRLVVRLDDKEIWSVTPYWKSPRAPTDPYVEASHGTYVASEQAPARSPTAKK